MDLRIPRRPRIHVLDRYIFFEILQPFLVSVLLMSTLLSSLVLKDVAGELIGKGIEMSRVLTYLVSLLGEKITQTIPLACLLGGILAAGRLSGDSEITAMRAAGISFPRIYSVFLFVGSLAAALVALMNLYLGPMSANAREDFETWLKSYHSLSLVRAGMFLGGGDIDALQKGGQDIYAERRDGSSLEGIQIRKWIYHQADNAPISYVNGAPVRVGESTLTQIIQAKRGQLFIRWKDPTDRTAGTEEFLRLEHGYMVETQPNFGPLRITDFREGFMDFVLPAPMPLGRLNAKPENYTFLELFDFLRKLERGEARINVPDVPGGTAIKVGEGGQRLPSIAEMRAFILKERLWVIQNQPLVGKPGGPTAAEVQARVQAVLQFELFLQDADRTVRKFEIEIHKRLAVPVASLLFFFVSFPLGLVVKRSGKGMSFALALFVFVVYYFLLTLGLNKAYEGNWSPWMGAWVADVGILGLGLYIMATRTDGFAPLRFLTAPIQGLFMRYAAPGLGRLRDRIPASWFGRAEKIRTNLQKRLEKWKKTGKD